MNTTTWNKIRYTIYTPLYDTVAGYFRASRKKSIAKLNIQKGQRVLLVGAGTGLDLEFLPTDCEIIATDLTPAMVKKIKVRSKLLELPVTAMEMNGERLDFKDDHFDAVILHLILAVLPDPIACIKEAERVLKPGGKIAIFDKFAPANKDISILRKALNLITNFLFSDITRDLSKIINHTNLKIVSAEDANFNGNFRIATLKKPTL